MKLIVGLGNPGKEYAETRHNVGFMVIDEYIKKKSNINSKEKFGGIYYEVTVDNEKFIFLKPQKYINLSGQVIREFIRYFKIDIKDILIIHDDLDTPCGSVKLRLSGGSGGHNGLKDIEACLNTKEYKRIKIGISNNKTMDTKDYVLGKFNDDNIVKINEAVSKAVDIINDFNLLSFENLMNKYN
jgi:PTH1 family peptidyl-tRNA hydrolase